MGFEEIIIEVNKIMIDLFGNKTINLNENTKASDIEEWDSLNHIRVVTALEKHFKIRFEINELLTFNTIGDLCKYILARTQSSK
jgi:acyl carrier protein